MATLVRFARLFVSTGIRTLKQEPALNLNSARAFSCTVRNLSDRKFTKEHEWVKLEGKVGTVGISDHAQESLGDIVFVDLPEQDREYEKDEECGAVESVKAASEIYSPVAGKIVAINSALTDNPGLVNTSCYEEGWMFKIELSNMSEYEEMLTEDKYKELLTGD